MGWGQLGVCGSAVVHVASGWLWSCRVWHYITYEGTDIIVCVYINVL